MSKLNQLAKLAEEYPVYFHHQYQKELSRAQSRNYFEETKQEEQPNTEGEWTAEEIKQERKRIDAYGKEGDTLPTSGGKAVRKRSKQDSARQ